MKITYKLKNARKPLDGKNYVSVVMEHDDGTARLIGELGFTDYEYQKLIAMEGEE